MEHFIIPLQLYEEWLNILVQPPKERFEEKISISIILIKIVKILEMNNRTDALAFMH